MREKLVKYWKKLKTLMVNPDESDLTKSISVSVGVFISIIPLWGFQTLTAVGAAFLFRLNKPLVIASSYLSVPPIIAPIIFFSMWLGSFFVAKAVHITMDNASASVVLEALQQYVIGSFVLAAITAPVFGAATYGILKVVAKRRA